MNSAGQPTGKTLQDLDKIGTWHGIVEDPSNKYILASLFTRGGGYVGIINTRTKGAVALFRVTSYSYKEGSSTTITDRSVHMAYWTPDGLQCIVISNLHRKAIECIYVKRDGYSDIISAMFDTDAPFSLGTNMIVSEAATYFSRNNGYESALIGGVEGNYGRAALQDLTPDGKCKENGCNLPGVNGGGGG
ncbi:hypothetical protein ACHAW5_008829 [Stephanodiscus triporus]|uniref:Uncharacterized protein n=1 Tax=Stephanodiscus triporus TaxID=2934178 RepID=A0ABD3MZY3_9STRA